MRRSQQESHPHGEPDRNGGRADPDGHELVIAEHRRRGRSPAEPGGADAAKPYRGAGGRAVSVAAAAPSALTLARSA